MKVLIAFIAGLIAAPLLLVVAGLLGWLGSTGTWSPTLRKSLGDRRLERAPQFSQQADSDLTPVEAFAAIHDGIRYTGMGA